MRPQVGAAVDKENEDEFDEVYFIERIFVSCSFPLLFGNIIPKFRVKFAKLHCGQTGGQTGGQIGGQTHHLTGWQ